ncbi:heart- and neural crest derivatives-expressed protein 2-like [Uloborus diversus]|uniref:heart- and neural crest derivatives-expressed protein 2-like n=1 Tax=Uloborus diversus TaxID=327109 RepID=UPI002409E341|nr:heart- and neural crest derivatives-expressed protein 2-like [Uloborus diversus]
MGEEERIEERGRVPSIHSATVGTVSRAFALPIGPRPATCLPVGSPLWDSEETSQNTDRVSIRPSEKMNLSNNSSLQPYGQPAPDIAFQSYYACGAGGETFYVWPAFATSPDATSPVAGPVRCLKRRVTNNRKERRRTMSINNAFADLRSCIPNIPSDSKLSKIKTLRLATSYIAYLTKVLAGEEESTTPQATFVAEIAQPVDHSKRGDLVGTNILKTRKRSGRTGWPEHVWALELKENT